MNVRRWEAAALVFGLLAGLGALVPLLTGQPGVPDDARMFLAWTGRWDDPGLLAGDLLADYWRSVTPWLFVAVFRAGWWMGIDPVTFARILPALLYPPIAWLCFRLLRGMEATAPLALLSTAVVLAQFAHADIVISGAPRALWPLCVLIALDGLQRRSVLRTALGQSLLTGAYPQLALVTAGLIALSFIAPAPDRWCDLSPRRLAIMAGAAVGTLVSALPFLLREDRFGPAYRLEEIGAIPAFASGRSAVLSADGRLDFFCGDRLGIFPHGCEGIGDPALLLLAVITLTGPVILMRRMRRPVAGRMRSALPFLLVVSSVACAAGAAWLLFRLHLPSRYTVLLPYLPALTTLPVLFEQAERLPRRLRRGGWAFALILCAVAVLSPKNVLRAPVHPALIADLAALPSTARIAGFLPDLDFSPLLTGRATLFNSELAVAYERGYFEEVIARMTGLRRGLFAPTAEARQRLLELDLDWLVIARETLEEGRLPPSSAGFFAPAASGPMTPERRGLLNRCAVRNYSAALLIDARCFLTGLQ